MWNNPHPTQGFLLCAADGTVLAELPPTVHFDSSIGRPEPPQPLAPRTNAPLGNSASAGDENGTRTVTVEETTTVDFYTWERAPFSDFWFQVGDGLPREKPPAPSTATVRTTTHDTTGGKIVEKTVTETVEKSVVLNGNQQVATTSTTTTTSATSSDTPEEHLRYAATLPYWGSAPPETLLETDSIEAVYTAAYSHGLEHRQEVWVVEWQASNRAYSVLDRLDAPPPPEIVLTGNWYYESSDEALIHAAEIESACAEATQLMLRGRTIATFAPGSTNLFQMKTADKLRDVTYTLTLYTTEYFTAQEFMRRQLT